VTGFSTDGGWGFGGSPTGDMWRVADVKAIVNASGVTTDCDVTALHPTGSMSGYRVGHDNNVSYEGN